MQKQPTQLVFSLFIIFFFFFFFVSLRNFSTQMAVAQSTTIPVNVGVVLDMDTWVGKMGLSCISMALSDFYDSHSYYKTRLVLNTRDSKEDIVGAAAAALDLLKNVEVVAIIGPSTSMQAGFVIDLGNKSQVPIISFSATSPSLSSIGSPYFIRATPNGASQVKAISAIVKAFGWREVVPIYVDNEFGGGIIPFLTDALQNVNARVPYRSILPPSATYDQIRAELYKLMTMQTRVFVVNMWSTLGSQFFINVKEIGMMGEGYVWILTDGLSDILSAMDHVVIDSMQGVLGVKPYIPRTQELKNFNIRWKRKFLQVNPDVVNAELNAFGLWAYDAATALAMVVENVTNFGFQYPNISTNSSTDLETFGVSQSGPKLLQALSSTTFTGLSGDFHIMDGQLQSSAYQIINVNGNSERGIGFWTAESGIVRELNFSDSNSTYSTSAANLKPIIWPGDTTSTPKGWVMPTNGKKLRIGVPVKDGFSEFVKVTRDNDTNTTIVTGYCIAVFDAIMATLPYAVPYEYIPFATPDGKSAGTYDKLVYQVYLGNYDAVVGDTTIIANRSQYVDFALPYTESGVSLIVPITDNKKKNPWLFLRPLTWDLWLITFCSFVFIGFAIWVLEHRINEDFRGPPSHQVGMIFWFSFSTMVFAHRERVVSNMARFVVIIWVFVVLILTQSYTASLTSLLTVQQLQPTVKNVEELIKNGDYVGYQKDSFVSGILMKKNFDQHKLIIYNSLEECDELLSKGSGHGGIAAAFDEIPYMKLFLARYCSKYIMVDPTYYKTDGFGFVFPIGSPLVQDVSRAVLNVTEGDIMGEIENAWLGTQSCPDSGSSLSSNSLGFESFRGLFLIAGIASFSAFFIFVAIFLYEHWHVLTCSDPKASMWEKIKVLAYHFDSKDLRSHTFSRCEVHNSIRVADGMDRKGVVDASPSFNFPPTPATFLVRSSLNTNGPPSPVTFSNHTVESPETVDQNPKGQIAQEMVPDIELATLPQDRPSISESIIENH